MKKITFNYWKSKTAKKWYFQIKASNGEIVAPSEGYSRKIDMMATIALIKFGAKDAPIRKKKG